MSTYRLYWRDQELGIVSATVGEFPWMSGDFAFTAVDPVLREFFEFMSGESPGDPPFEEELLDEENWWLVEPGGSRRGITVPAVRISDGEIAWRWR
jgi:hypothetical protein